MNDDSIITGISYALPVAGEFLGSVLGMGVGMFMAHDGVYFGNKIKPYTD